MHIYAFGSLCRGEVDRNSDIDLLALVDGFDKRFDPDLYSIYSYRRLESIWKEGTPFSWHLFLEARLIFTANGVDYINGLGQPAPYRFIERDCRKFQGIFQAAAASLLRGTNSESFEISNMFLSLRNFATCFSLRETGIPTFSRCSALKLGAFSLQVPDATFRLLERGRVLCTRGIGDLLEQEEVEVIVATAPMIESWMQHLMKEIP